VPRDTIQIGRLNGALHAEQIRVVVECLEADGHRCAVFDGFDGIGLVQRDQRTKLLFLGAADADLPRLVEAIRAAHRDDFHVPLLLYLTQRPPDDNGLLVPEIDDFLLEPLNLQDLRLRVRRLLQRFAIEVTDTGALREDLTSHVAMRQFIGRAVSFLAMLARIPRVARTEATVLLTGETGTGKEMCARAIHYLSRRADSPFIPVNCGALPDHLFENELFGHAKGAYTDASSAEKGLLAEAEGGTLFLDEIDTLSPSAQIKVLRVLQDHEYRPLGSSKAIVADVRIVSATNSRLREQVETKLFRDDLYHRLNVLSLSLPPLRERVEDILLLANHFLAKYSAEQGRSAPRLSQAAMQQLFAYRWPGNVRELEGVIQRAVVLTSSPVLQPDDLELGEPLLPDAPGAGSLRKAKAMAIDQFERAYLTRLLAAHQGNISRAARAAGKERRAFQRLLRKHRLNGHTFREAV
jgi:DNA-binding NtrC family response regulator